MKQLDSTGLKRLHREWRRRTEDRLALILESVESPFNVGAIVRTAAAYRVEALWLCGSTAALESSNVKKMAMGTERYLTVERVEKTSDAIEAARQDGYTVIGVELTDGARPMHELDLDKAVCLVVGHEDRGLDGADNRRVRRDRVPAARGACRLAERRHRHRRRPLRSTTTGMDKHA